MTSSTNKLTNAKPAKALLAIAFAGNLLTAQLPALSQAPRLASTSMIDFISKNSQIPREEKAYRLLQLANIYITGTPSTVWEASVRAGSGEPGSIRDIQILLRREGYLLSWADRVSLQSYSVGTTALSEAGRKIISSENRVVADNAIKAAIEQLGQGSERAESLNMYLIASGLSRMTGNTQNEKKCTKVLNAAIHACEVNKTVDSSQIKMISSILNSMAYVYIPIEIEDYPMQSRRQPPAFDMKNFDQGERLHLRAAALLDRLPAADHDRRKAHRDLSLWYQQLGKVDKSLKEKQELFNLVGVKDDRMLYPQPRTCGHDAWWTVEKTGGPRFCGMG